MRTRCIALLGLSLLVACDEASTPQAGAGQDDQFDQGVFDITVDSSVAARDVPGGTAPTRVEEALARAHALLEA